jgi:WD40 repeat protein
LLPAAWDFPSRRLAVGSEDLEIWDVDTGVRLFHAKAAHDVLMYPSTAKNGIHSLRWSRDGQRVVTCDFLGTAKLWDLEAGHEPRVFKLVRSAWALCPDLLLAVQAVRDTANGPTQLRVWDFKSDSLRTSLQVDDNVPLYALSDNGRWLAVKTSDNRLRVHDLATGELIRELTGPGGVRLFQWRDEQLLAFGPKADFKRWDIASGKELQSFDGIRDWLCWSASLSPDGQRLVVVDSDGIPKIVDTESGKVVMSLSGHQSPVFTVAWSPDGTRIATVSSGQVRIWDSVSRLDDAGASATASSPETSVAAPTISTPGQRDAPNPKNKARGKRRRSTG